MKGRKHAPERLLLRLDIPKCSLLWWHGVDVRVKVSRQVMSRVYFLITFLDGED